MKKITLLGFLLPIFFSTNLFGQISAPELSFGILYSRTKTIFPADQESRWRRGQWLSISNTYKIRKWFHIETGLTYQERIPLEVLEFRSGTPYQNGGTSGVSLIWPSNKQSPNFNQEYFTAFPNFKYLGLELIPSITMGQKLSITIGAGLFGAILLNRDETTVTKEKLGSQAVPLANRLDALDPISYHKTDFGWIPRIKIQYQLWERAKIGIQVKSYQSLVRLNDTYVYRDLAQNIRWIAFAGGLSLQYELGKIE